MRDKKKSPLRLEGRGVVLEEICPKYFEPVIRWRNDPVLNHFLNQPYKLTMEKETEWYEKIYLPDDTQGFLVLVDKKNGVPFGTMGWSEMDEKRRQCVSERLLLGNPSYQNSGPFLESFFLHADYLYQFVDRVYGHIRTENRKALHLNKFIGMHPNKGEIQYPEKLFVQGDRTRPQVEYVRTREEYEQVKKKMFTDILDLLYPDDGRA